MLQCRPQETVQVGAVQQGVRYTDELPKLHKEIKHDVHWIGSIHAQADRVVKVCVRLTEIVKASKGYGPYLVSNVSRTLLQDALKLVHSYLWSNHMYWTASQLSAGIQRCTQNDWEPILQFMNCTSFMVSCLHKQPPTRVYRLRGNVSVLGMSLMGAGHDAPWSPILGDKGDC